MKSKAATIALVILGTTVFFAFAVPSTVSYERPEEAQHVVSVLASVTKYGPTGNPMANGEMPYIGAVAVSDRTIPLGTVIVLDGKEYTVKDRTAKWVHDRHGLTVDIYSEEAEAEMLEFGRQRKTVQFFD